jgi:outer membrane protein OmpA-like peptidoglycan-associated protein
LNGTGDVGLSGGSTSARISALGTLDLRQLKKGFPLRVNLNLGYKVDDSGKAVEDVEARRKKPITRIERYGLGISKVDYFQTALGVEVPFWFLQPYLEWSVDVPVNRQGWECHTDTISRGDVCLGLTDLSNPNGDGAGFKYVPSRFSIGTRVSPFKSGPFRGLSGHLAFDIATSGMNEFIEEVAPESPWMMHIGLGFAFDAKEKPVEKAQPLPPQIVNVPAQENLVRGFVHETGKPDAVPNAIVAFQGNLQPPLATGADGRFLSRNLALGAYTFEISAPGYKPGTCAVTVAPPRQTAPQQGPFMGGGFPPPQQPPPQQGPNFTDVDCQLEALPRTGNLMGTVKDGDGKPVAGAIVTVTDSLGKDQKATSDGTGSFKMESMAPGEITIKVEAKDYMNHVEQGDIRPNEDTKRSITINHKPKNPLVTIQGNELKLGDKVLFETDSAKILGQSSALLEEVADTLAKHPEIEEVEVQGHTDNTSTREHNQSLSDQRASAVRDWLVKAGVAANRLVAKGYGQDKPLAPNVTEANKAKNRRVQFIILKKTGG